MNETGISGLTETISCPDNFDPDELSGKDLLSLQQKRQLPVSVKCLALILTASFPDLN
jgi:hypothetical protein